MVFWRVVCDLFFVVEFNLFVLRNGVIEGNDFVYGVFGCL